MNGSNSDDAREDAFFEDSEEAKMLAFFAEVARKFREEFPNEKHPAAKASRLLRRALTPAPRRRGCKPRPETLRALELYKQGRKWTPICEDVYPNYWTWTDDMRAHRKKKLIDAVKAHMRREKRHRRRVCRPDK